MLRRIDAQRPLDGDENVVGRRETYVSARMRQPFSRSTRACI